MNYILFQKTNRFAIGFLLWMFINVVVFMRNRHSHAGALDGTDGQNCAFDVFDTT